MHRHEDKRPLDEACPAGYYYMESAELIDRWEKKHPFVDKRFSR